MHNQLTITEIISQANTSHIRQQALLVQKSPLIAIAEELNTVCLQCLHYDCI